MKNVLLTTTLLTLMSAANIASAAPINLVKNGSFENPDVKDGGSIFVSKIEGWIGGANGIEIRHNRNGVADTGYNFIELDTTANSSISQTVANTFLGHTYRLEFAYSPREGRGEGQGRDIPDKNGDISTAAQVSFNGESHKLSGKSNTYGNFWTTHSYTFTALSDDITLKFAALGDSDTFGGNIDSVALYEVSAVPVPAAALLFAPALLGFMGLRRKAKK